MYFANKYLSFNKKERKGIVVFISLIFSSFLFTYLSPLLVNKSPSDFSSFNTEINAFLSDSLASFDENTDKFYVNKNSITHNHKLFTFDPNKASSEELYSLGLNPKTILNIKKYLKRGGVFKNKNDFKKIYGLSKTDFLLLEPYISINQSTYQFRNTKFLCDTCFISKSHPANEIRINSVGLFYLLKFDGMDTILAFNILKYRKALGGYYCNDQLSEVNGMKKEFFNRLKDMLIINQDSIKKINLNQCSINDLNKHPYLSYNQSNSIINFRIKHGDFKTLSDIKKCDLIDDKTFEKIHPYLDLN